MRTYLLNSDSLLFEKLVMKVLLPSAFYCYMSLNKEVITVIEC